VGFLFVYSYPPQQSVIDILIIMRLLVWIFVLVITSPAVVAEAASLYMDPASSTLGRGDTAVVAVRLDTDEAAGECVNAVSAVITYDPSIQPVDVSRGDSIFSVWVEEPVINPTERTISFAGGIPNGYCGRIEGDPRLSNVLVSIVFRSPGLQIGGGSDADKALVSFTSDSVAYLNDGLGTLAPIQLFGATLNLERTPGAEIVDTWRDEVRDDQIPPQEFSIELTRDEKAFNGDYFIVFNTTDKETGISHYEVMEEPVSEMSRFSWGSAQAPWVKARSPYVLTDQSLNSVIRVRALDKAGNEYIATLVPEESLRGHSLLNLMLIAGAAVLLLLLLLGVWLFVRQRQRRKRSALSAGAGLSGDDVAAVESDDTVT
jgi:hypothetical protein